MFNLLKNAGRSWNILVFCLGLQPVTLAQPLFPASTAGEAQVVGTSLEPNVLLEGMHGNSAVRQRTREQLLAIGTPIVPSLMEALDDPDWVYRWEAVNSLGYLRDPRAICPLVQRVVEDPSNHVRWRAWWALKVTDPRGEIALKELRSRLEDAEPIFRWNAAIGLTMYETGEVLSRIQEGLNSSDPWIRWEAVNALGRLKAPESIPWLAGLLADPEDRVRREVVGALASIGGQEALNLLMRLLDSAEAGIRLRAVKGLIRLADPASLPNIERRQSIEKDPVILSELRRALQIIQRTDETLKDCSSPE